LLDGFLVQLLEGFWGESRRRSKDQGSHQRHKEKINKSLLP